MYSVCIAEVAYDGIGQRFCEDKGRDGPPRKERGLYAVLCRARTHVCVRAYVRACVRACVCV